MTQRSFGKSVSKRSADENILFKSCLLNRLFSSKALLEQGMEALTLVQSKAIPVVLSGKDALIKSQTGSGKTLAYAVPILHKLQVRILSRLGQDIVI